MRMLRVIHTPAGDQLALQCDCGVELRCAPTTGKIQCPVCGRCDHVGVIQERAALGLTGRAAA